MDINIININMQIDYIIQGIIFSKFSSTEFNTYYIFPIIIMFLIMKNNTIYSYMSEKIDTFFEDKNKSSIIFKKGNKSKSTMNFKALMYYISTKPDPTIRKLAENVEFGWNSLEEDNTEKFSGYRISQSQFKFDDIVFGKFWIEEKNEGNTDNKRFQEFWNLEVYSNKLKTLELIEWIENKTNEYKEYIKKKTYNNQIIIDISYNHKEDDIDTEHEIWTSNVTFENRFFDNKDLILSKIDFFLKNREWYVRKGIPYTLGFLLYGKPGCGKTSFIKALLNYTKRHCINIKLTDNFDLDSLKDVIQKEKIEDYIIPNNNRILVFEDIDCMGQMVKRRKDTDELVSNNISFDEEVLLQNLSEKDKENIKKVLAVKNKERCNSKNNLSYFLNILDGLVEGDGRIIIMTTNKPDALDPALIRPGRIDEKIEFKELGISDLINILVSFYELEDIEKNKLDLEIHKNKDKFDRKYTPAELINICRGYNNINLIKKHFEIDK